MSIHGEWTVQTAGDIVAAVRTLAGTGYDTPLLPIAALRLITEVLEEGLRKAEKALIQDDDNDDVVDEREKSIAALRLTVLEECVDAYWRDYELLEAQVGDRDGIHYRAFSFAAQQVSALLAAEQDAQGVVIEGDDALFGGDDE